MLIKTFSVLALTAVFVLSQAVTRSSDRAVSMRKSGRPISQSAGKVLVEVINPDKGLGGAQILLDGAYAGDVGDTLEVARGKRQLGISAPFDYSLLIDLSVDAVGSAAILDADWDGPPCEFVRPVSWTKPTLELLATAGGPKAYRLALATPKIGAEGKERSRCTHPVAMGCPGERSARTKYESQPDGAQVYVKGQLVGVAPLTLNTIFCPGEPIKVLFRKAGFVNCSRELLLKPQTSVTLSCALKAK